MSVESLLAVDAAAGANSLFVSPISAWELGAASRKKNLAMRPQLRGLRPENWFVRATGALGAIAAPITQEIGLAACALPEDYGHADPGDCLLIATAHVLGLTLLTRDQRILEFSRRNAAYLGALAC
jgi:PIN domain nuclease of toxin-antitoxin system